MTRWVPLRAALLWLLLIVVVKAVDALLNGAVSAALRSRRVTLKLFWFRFDSACIPSRLCHFTARYRSHLRRFFRCGAVLTLFLVPLVVLFLLLNLAHSFPRLYHRPASPSNHPTLPVSSRALLKVAHHSFRHLIPNHTSQQPSPISIPPPRRRLLYLRPRTNATTSTPPTSSITVLPYLPTIDYAASDLPLLLFALLLSALLHELGHLLAALTYRAHVSRIGIFVAFLFPGAFVTIQNLSHLPVKSQLSIACAGVWHNLLTTLTAFALIPLVPFLSLPLYSQGAAAIVTSLPPRSGLANSVQSADLILAVADTNLTNGVQTFQHVLTTLHSSPTAPGFCLPDKLLRQRDAPCCRMRQWRAFAPSHTTRCFTSGSRAACIDAVKAALQPICQHDSDCAANRRCARPQLRPHDRLVVLTVRRKRAGVVRVLFDGTVPQLWASVKLSSFVPRGWPLMTAWMVEWVAWLDLPNMLVRALWYVAGISLTLAASNMAPAAFLDGQLFVEMVVAEVARRWDWKERRAAQVKQGVVWGGTAVVAANVALSLWFMTR